MKLQHLISALEEVEAFSAPDFRLEQYCTGVEIAAHSLFEIQSHFGDVEGRFVADIGCGTGMLGIGCALLGAAHVVGFDVDEAALEQARANIAALDLEDDVDCVRCDVLAAGGLPLVRRTARLRPDDAASACAPPPEPVLLPAGHGVFDTAVMNPPFGTRRPGADVGFVAAGLAAVHAEGCVYSMHKSTTRSHLVQIAERLGVGCEVVAQLRFDLPATYAFHRADSVDVPVDLLRFVKGRAGAALAARHSAIPPFVDEGSAGGGGGGGRGGSSRGGTAAAGGSRARGASRGGGRGGRR